MGLFVAISPPRTTYLSSMKTIGTMHGHDQIKMLALIIRLLRNRVSAQQARERKKAYLSELEVRVKDLEKRNSELEERLSTLQNENQMLRQVHAAQSYYICVCTS